jgi:hypothetical protein
MRKKERKKKKKNMTTVLVALQSLTTIGCEGLQNWQLVRSPEQVLYRRRGTFLNFKIDALIDKNIGTINLIQ